MGMHTCVCVCVFNLIIWHIYIYIYIYIYLFICLFVYLFIYYYFFISISYAIICIYACIIYMIIYVWTLTIDSLKPTMLKAPRRMRARVLGSEATPGGSSQSTWETISRIHPEEFGQGHWKPLALRENFWENEEKSKLETETETILIFKW